MVKGPIEGTTGISRSWDYVATAKLEYGISINPKDYTNIQSISWKVKINATHSSLYHFVGFVSNRAKDSTLNPYYQVTGNGLLPDAFGISPRDHQVFKGTKGDENTGCVTDNKYKGCTHLKSWISVKYIIRSQELLFRSMHFEDEFEYRMVLDIDVHKITHLYPCVALREVGDECEIGEVRIE